jgi:soluble lytic murein transglycosylase
VRRLILLACTLWLAWQAHIPAGIPPKPQQGSGAPAVAADLRPTVHPALPSALNGYWLVPPPGWKPAAGAAVRDAALKLGRAAALIANDNGVAALPLVDSRALDGTPLQAHALYVRGLAQLTAKRYDAARKAFASVRGASPTPALAERAAMGEADAAEAMNDMAGALAVYESLPKPLVVAGDDLLLRTARAAAAVGDGTRAARAWERLYFEYPSTDAGATAASQLASVPRDPIAPGNARFNAELARAERLFADRRFSLARDGFALLLPHAAGDRQELVALRLAECDYSMRRYRSAADRLRPLLDGAAREAEARYFYLLAARALGDGAAYRSLVSRLVADHPTSTWAEDALNNLGSHFIVLNEDEQADGVFRELLDRYPLSRHAPRAAWKVGWWAYKHGQYAEAAEVFERAASAFPRNDYRPPWLYWSGRAREQTGSVPVAIERYRLLHLDYENTYYGRLATQRLKSLRSAPDAAGAAPARWQIAGGEAPAVVPASDLLSWLIYAGLYQSALDEVVYLQKTAGRTPALDATRAWLLNRTGELRAGINLMRATYPHFMAAGGGQLPADIQRVIFPIDYWPLIKESAAARGLDPYFVAALVAQESTFDPKIRSSANAIGLMQIVPSTGRRWARKLGIRPFSTARLTTPAVNVKIGTAYFADLLNRFGGLAYALAGYNAGDSRVARWIAERPGLPREEFIDDIPFPETQNYVKRILGTADDYRRLYGGANAPATAEPAPAGTSAARPASSAGPTPVIVRPRR